MRTPQGEGQEGVRAATTDEMQGNVVESREIESNATFRTPGATVRLRGVEANTAMTNGFALDAPMGKAAGTVSCSELDIGGTGFGTPETEAQDVGAHPELMREGRE